jgi:hypothetical protein
MNPHEPLGAGRYATLALGAFALIVLPLALYSAGYLWLGECLEVPFIGYPPSHAATSVIRTYPHQWMATIFQPAGKMERWWRGIEVSVESGMSLKDMRHYLSQATSIT